MNLYLIFFLSLILQGCEENIIPIPEPEEPSTSSKLKVVWQEPIGVTDTFSYLSDGPLIVENKLTIGPNKSGRSVLSFRDKLTGQLLFEWDDWLKSSFFSERGQIIEDNIFIHSWHQTFLINSANGSTIWKSEIIDHGEPRTNITLGEIFHPTRNDSPQYNDYGYLTNLDKSSGRRDTLLTIKKVNDYELSIEPPTGWINQNGDSLLIFLVRSLDFGGTLDEQLDAYAYNLSADSIEWKLIDFDIEGSSKTGPPLVEDNLVFFAGQRTFYCLNAADGSEVWKRRFENNMGPFTEDLFSSAFIKVGNRLVISPSNANTYSFDAFSGEQLWEKSNSVSSPRNMVHHKGIIYTVGRGDGKLFAFDLETGEHFWREHPPNFELDDRASFSNKIDLDPETGYIYLDDRYFVMCIKPYKR